MDWLEKYTKDKSGFWFETIQTLIQKHSLHCQKGCHSETHPLAWTVELATQVCDRLPDRNHNASYDENIRMAMVMSMILSHWALRIRHGKISDPNRPVEARQKAYRENLEYIYALFGNMIDYSEDPYLMPGQSWESPFIPDATDGGYL